MLKLTKIVHLTSVHPRYDTRIFIKMCNSLAKIDEYDVILVVADGKGDEITRGVKIYDVGEKASSRILRMTNTVKKVYKKAEELNGDIYHLHDPELIPIGLKLKKLGKKVIFDAHEDLSEQILTKPYLNKPTRLILAKIIKIYEKYACKNFDYIVVATPYIRDKFLKINKNCCDINNYPLLNELYSVILWENKKDEICYVGGITKIRGIKEIIKAMGLTKDVMLNLAGTFSEKDIELEVKSYKGWEKVNELGFIDRKGVADIMARSKAGILTYYPLPNHIEARPNKLFEYMSAGISVIASNFQLWKEIVEGNNCGICVDPLNPEEIANAIKYIFENPEEAKKMGQNGRKAVELKYNWENEAKKLIEVYNKII